VRRFKSATELPREAGSVARGCAEIRAISRTCVRAGTTSDRPGPGVPGAPPRVEAARPTGESCEPCAASPSLGHRFPVGPPNGQRRDWRRQDAELLEPMARRRRRAPANRASPPGGDRTGRSEHDGDATAHRGGLPAGMGSRWVSSARRRSRSWQGGCTSSPAAWHGEGRGSG
jgi:hypothetical protein